MPGAQVPRVLIPGAAEPAAPSPSEAAANAETPPAVSSFANAQNYGAAQGPDVAMTNMLGDFFVGGSMGSSNLTLTEDGYNATPYGNGRVAVPIASHQFKTADNESPWPRTRIIYSANYFDHVGDNTHVTQQIVGFEHVVLGGRGSIGLRLPIYTVGPGSTNPGSGSPDIGTYGAGTTGSGNVGDLTLITKYALYYDPRGGNVLSVGAVVVTPTGGQTIGGVTPLYTISGVDNCGTIQPYVAFYKTLGAPGAGLFLQGFIATDSPFNTHDATFMYNDFGLGYIIRRNQRRGLTALVPLVEAHCSNPLNNVTHTVNGIPGNINAATAMSFNNISGTVSYDTQVNLLSGLTAVFNRTTTVSLGIVVPTVHNYAYNYEMFLQLNRYFGTGGPPYVQR